MDKQFLAAKHGYDCDMAGNTVTAWRDARPQPDWDALWEEQVKEKRIAAIKRKAGEIIEARYPLTTQLNMLARYSELCGRFVIFPLTAEAAEKAQLEAAYDWIRAVRAESNRLEQNPEAVADWPPAPQEGEG